MPSFLNKVFGYKKHDDKDTARSARDASDNTLLDGKYEAISPVLSPSVSQFAESQSTRDPDRDVGFSFFKPKSRAVSQKSAQKYSEAVVPHLTLRLPGPKGNSDSRALGAVFEADPDAQVILDDATIAAKRLSPSEALVLVRACSQVISERGLETLGIMHPHWFSASPDAQRKLISLFIRSLTPQSRTTTLPETPSSSTKSAFENELFYARSPHDVAAVLRWGLRHLSLENGYFGKDCAEWAWYNSFFHAERNASYPPNAFSQLLLPQLPPRHIELLTATLNLISSLASHAEKNSISGSKLSKFLGLWLLLSTRADTSDDWNQFYTRWERAGRILEHLFLARLREESLESRLPTRLQELCKHYPYDKGSLATADDLLSRPRFSTRQYDVLFVRVETLLTNDSGQPKQHPIQLLLEAFQLAVENPSGNEHVALWNTLKTMITEEAESSDSEGPQFTRIFTDETMQLLSLIPPDINSSISPIFLASPTTRVVPRKRSSSFSKVLQRALSKSSTVDESVPASPTSPSSTVVADWTQFSLSGFGDAPATQPLTALLDQDDDVEVTRPRISRRSSRQLRKSRSRRRRSEDREPLENPPSPRSEPAPSIVETKLGSVRVVQIDEAFIDFWSDAIVDPISSNWPVFIVCGLKQVPNAQQPIRWLLIEQAYSRQQPQTHVPSPDASRGRSPRPSAKSDISGFRINTVLSSARKRFSVFSKSATELSPKKPSGKNLATGELGEVLAEEEQAPLSRVDRHANGKTAIGAVVATVTISAITDQLQSDEISTAPIAPVPSTDLLPTPKEGSDPFQVAAEALSVEPTPQSGGRHNDSSEAPRWHVKSSEEAIFVEQGSSRTLDAVDSTVDNTANTAAKTIPVTADSASDSVVLDPGSVLTVENSDAEIQAEHVAIEVGEQSVEPVTQHAESRDGLSDVVQVDDGLREVSEAIAVPPAHFADPPTAVTIVNDDAPEPTAEEIQVSEEWSRKAPIDPTFAVESVGQQETDHLSSLSAVSVQDKVIVAVAGAQLAPDSVASVADGVEEAKEVAENAEIPTPTAENVPLVEETPSPEIGVAACTAGVVVEDQSTTAELQATPESWESATHHLEASALLAVDTSAHAVTVGAEQAMSQNPGLGAQLIAHGTIVSAGEDDVLAVTASAGQESEDVALVQSEAQATPESIVPEASVLEAPPSIPEHTALANQILGPVAADACELVDDAPAALESGVVEVSAPDFQIEAAAKEAQLPTQIEPMGALSTELSPEVATAASSTTVDEIMAVKADDQQASDAPVEDAQSEGSLIEKVTTSEPADVVLTAAIDTDPVENKATAHATEEALTIVEHVAPSEDEFAVTSHSVHIEDPVAQDVESAVEIEGPSNESEPQSVDEATNHPMAVVSASEETFMAKVEVQPEAEAVHRAIDDSVDESQVVAGDAEPDCPASQVPVTADEVQDVLDTNEPGALATEPASVLEPVVEDVAAHVEADELSPVVAKETEDDVARYSDTAPAVEVDEASGNDDEPRERGEQAVVASNVDDSADELADEPASADP